MTDAPPAYEDEPTQPAMAVPPADQDPQPEWGGTPFRVSRRGYDRAQVDSYLAEVWDAVQELQADAAAAQQQAQAAAEETQRLRKERELGRPEADVIGNRVGQILSIAEAEAEQVIQQARAKMARVDQDRDALLHDAQQQHDNLIAEAREQAEHLITEARKESAQIREAAHRNVAALRAERSAILADLARTKDRVAQAIEQASATPERQPAPHRPQADGAAAVVQLPDAQRAESASR